MFEKVLFNAQYTNCNNFVQLCEGTFSPPQSTNTIHIFQIQYNQKGKKNCLMRNNMQQNVILLLYYFFDWPFREKFVFEGIEAERFWREWSQGMVNLSKKWKGRFWGDNILFSGPRSYVVYFDQPMGAPQAVRWVDRLLCRFNGTRVMLTSSLLFYILFSHKMSQKITKKHIIKGV